MTMQELFAVDGSWTQGELARDNKGNSVCSFSTEAVQWCLLGATIKCYSKDTVFGQNHQYLDVFTMLRKKIGSVVNYNNEEGRTIDDIRKLCRELNI